ncbi:hypothetical protein L1887_19159 [Cichorium endivia]|nr:hypothetical protein L1887_19159 [Cichorium endivia]
MFGMAAVMQIVWKISLAMGYKSSLNVNIRTVEEVYPNVASSSNRTNGEDCIAAQMQGKTAEFHLCVYVEVFYGFRNSGNRRDRFLVAGRSWLTGSVDVWSIEEGEPGVFRYSMVSLGCDASSKGALSFVFFSTLPFFIFYNNLDGNAMGALFSFPNPIYASCD